MKPPNCTLKHAFVLIPHSLTRWPRGVCFAALFAAALVLFTSSARAQSRSLATSTPAPSHNSTSGGPSQDPSTPVVFRPLYVPSGCGLVPSGPEGAEEARASLIDKKGPQEPAIFSMSTFTVMGFAKGSWPVVIDYLLEQDSLLIVVIAPEGTEPIIYRLDGKKGHWQNRLSLPAQLGDQPLVAHYAIRALDDTAGQIGPSHLHIHGIAAGPKAVGSIGIDRINFSPAAISVEQGEKARYMFHSISDFKNVEVDFIRLALSSGQIIAARVGGKSVGGVSKNTLKDGDWDGKSDGGGKAAKGYSPELQQWLRAPHGQHLVQVRGWWGAKDGGDWVTALSDDYVTVK
jgi:hypothetical protein